MKRLLFSAALLVLLPGRAVAQGYLVKLDARFQSVAYRGVRLDSIPTTAVDTAPDGGLYTANGYAVDCASGDSYCSFYRAGSAVQSAPSTLNADITVWGLGLPGLSLHGNARLGADLLTSGAWPGTDPAVQLAEGYARYQRDWVTAQVGRQIHRGRLGYAGYDGAMASARSARLGLTGEAYIGVGLARGSLVPVTSDAVNPFNDFQPIERQLVTGVDGEWRFRFGSLRAEYQREVDRDTRNFVSERTSLAASVSPMSSLRLDAGTEYDIARGLWGSSEVNLTFSQARYGASAGIRQYRPYFDLWTIWGVFSPVGYDAYRGNVWVRPQSRIELHASGEHYQYEATHASTPLVDVEDQGWRWAAGAGVTLAERWLASGNYHREFGPGASSSGWDGSVSWTATSALSLTADGGHLVRPIELRYSESHLGWVGLHGDFKASERLRFGVGGTWYGEDRQRPDASSLDWNQTRIIATMTWLFGSSADRLPLPPPVRRRGSR